MTGTLQSSMAALCTVTIIFAAHVVSVAGGVPLRAPKLVSESAWRTSQSSQASNEFFRGPELADGTMVPVLPFVVEVAQVTGEVKGADAAAGWAGGARGLLHGKRRRSAYSRCPTCTMITCRGQDGLCSGHCKRRRKLFTCRRQGAFNVASPCIDNRPDFTDLPPDRLPPLNSILVTANAPFIGCANITGLPSTCPAEGTRGESDDGQRFTVLGSACEQHRYSIQQCEREGANITPFYPFGYCECVTRSDAGVVDMAPCRLSELRYTAPETGGVPVRVFPEGNTTITRYGVTEELDVGRHRRDMMFNTTGGTVDVKIIVNYATLNEAENITFFAPFAQSP